MEVSNLQLTGDTDLKAILPPSVSYSKWKTGEETILLADESGECEGAFGTNRLHFGINCSVCAQPKD